jgi:hypothetical protein
MNGFVRILTMYKAFPGHGMYAIVISPVVAPQNKTSHCVSGVLGSEGAAATHVEIEIMI